MNMSTAHRRRVSYFCFHAQDASFASVFDPTAGEGERKRPEIKRGEEVKIRGKFPPGDFCPICQSLQTDESSSSQDEKNASLGPRSYRNREQI